MVRTDNMASTNHTAPTPKDVTNGDQSKYMRI